jgi:hypothetical protein
MVSKEEDQDSMFNSPKKISGDDVFSNFSGLCAVRPSPVKSISSFTNIKKKLGSDSGMLSDASISLFGGKKLVSEDSDSMKDGPMKLD